MQDNGWLLSSGEKLRLQIFFLPPNNFTFLRPVSELALTVYSSFRILLDNKFLSSKDLSRKDSSLFQIFTTRFGVGFQEGGGDFTRYCSVNTRRGTRQN